jgi:hypothetical protein
MNENPVLKPKDVPKRRKWNKNNKNDKNNKNNKNNKKTTKTTKTAKTIKTIKTTWSMSWKWSFPSHQLNQSTINSMEK